MPLLRMARVAPLIIIAVVAVAMAGPPSTDGGLGPLPGADDSDVASFPVVHGNPFTPLVFLAVVLLLGLSGFFSGTETALLSLDKLQLRNLRAESGVTGPRIAAMLDDPGRLLTNILVCNISVNVLIGIVMGARMDMLLEHTFPELSSATVYGLSVVIVSFLLIFFGEILPKVLAVGTRVFFSRVAVLPLTLTDKLVAPVRDAMIGMTNLLFRLTRLDELQAVPFMTTEEFKAVLNHSEAQGVIEEDERQMIQGILDITDTHVREILVPRPDVIAVPESATVEEARALFREHEYSRMPVYSEDLDHMTGLLVCKDLLPCIAAGGLEQPVKEFARPPFFVPETMTVYQFVRDAQRRRMHLAIVVDEYGGTRGIVTLEDAMEEVVGDITDENEQEELEYERLGETDYRVEGSMAIDALSDLIGVKLEDEEHATVAGFIMNHTDKVPEPGDQIEYAGVLFTVERVEGKRAESLRIRVLPPAAEEESGS